MQQSAPRRALGCLFTSGFAAVPRGAFWGAILALPGACYCCATFPYGGGIVAGPVVALAGPIAGALIAFLVGAAVGLYRAGYRWAVLLVPALAGVVVFPPYGWYAHQQSNEAEYRQLIYELRDDDSSPFLAQLHTSRGRSIVEDHLEQFLVCAGSEGRLDVIDALADLDPRKKDGYALCAVSRYGQPATVSHLLAEGYEPARAHRVSGETCEPLHELSAASTGSSPCSLSMLGDFDEFSATPTAAGCRHRAMVATLLVEAGAPSSNANSFVIAGCTNDGGPSPADSGSDSGDR